jgi:alkylhydroperoxidase family enzyme
MRLAEVERGDTVRSRLLIRFISLVSRIRLPDAARVAFYHRDFAGGPLASWTQRAMRGPSTWTVGEREIMAAMVGTWNSTEFCIGAHRATATGAMDGGVVDAAMRDYRSAPISEQLRSALTFLEKMTREPDQLTDEDARAVLATGVTRQQLLDAAAVATVFNVITRYADALDFTIPSNDEFDAAAKMLLKRGYA